MSYEVKDGDTRVPGDQAYEEIREDLYRLLKKEESIEPGRALKVGSDMWLTLKVNRILDRPDIAVLKNGVQVTVILCGSTTRPMEYRCKASLQEKIRGMDNG